MSSKGSTDRHVMAHLAKTARARDRHAAVLPLGHLTLTMPNGFGKCRAGSSLSRMTGSPPLKSEEPDIHHEFACAIWKRSDA